MKSKFLSILSIGVVSTFLLSGCVPGITGQVNISEINQMSKKQLENKLTVEYDEYRDITFVKPYQDMMTGIIYRNPYIELQNEKKFLHLKHVGYDWVFIKEVNILRDGKRFKFDKFKRNKSDVEALGVRGSKKVYVTEKVYINLSNEDLKDLEIIRKSKDTKMLIVGSNDVIERVIDKSSKEYILMTLEYLKK